MNSYWVEHALSEKHCETTNHWKSVTYLTLVRRKSIVPRSGTLTNWNDASTATGPLWVKRLLNVLLDSGTSVHALALVLEADIFSTRCNKDNVMWHVWLFERQWTITASYVCRYSVNHSNVHFIITRWRLTMALQFSQGSASTYALCEVDILDTVLLRVYSGTLLPIFIEIGSYLTDKEQKISWHSFFETRCISSCATSAQPRAGGIEHVER